MPILFMGLMAFAVLVIMGFLLFFAVFEESHERRKKAQPTAARH